MAYQLLHTCVHSIYTYLVCHKATALQAPLLYTSTRLLIQVATGTMDDSPCCRLTGVHHGKCTHGPVLGQHVYYILKRADKASLFWHAHYMPVTYYIHPPGCSYKWPLPHWMSTPSYSPSSREKTKHHSLRMHITCQLCQAGRTCTCPLSTREGEQAAPNHEMLWCLGAGKCITYIEAK